MKSGESSCGSGAWGWIPDSLAKLGFGDDEVRSGFGDDELGTARRRMQLPLTPTLSP